MKTIILSGQIILDDIFLSTILSTLFLMMLLINLITTIVFLCQGINYANKPESIYRRGSITITQGILFVFYTFIFGYSTMLDLSLLIKTSTILVAAFSAINLFLAIMRERNNKPYAHCLIAMSFFTILNIVILLANFKFDTAANITLILGAIYMFVLTLELYLNGKLSLIPTEDYMIIFDPEDKLRLKITKPRQPITYLKMS